MTLLELKAIIDLLAAKAPDARVARGGDAFSLGIHVAKRDLVLTPTEAAVLECVHDGPNGLIIFT